MDGASASGIRLSAPGRSLGIGVPYRYSRPFFRVSCDTYHQPKCECVKACPQDQHKSKNNYGRNLFGLGGMASFDGSCIARLRSDSHISKEETYCLTSQLRRAAVSVPSNIAEGTGRAYDKEVIQFLNHSRGSLCEIETQIVIATRLGYVEANTSETILRQASRVGQLLNGLIRSLRSPSAA